ncbi:MAG: GtrA family protein [Saprospiraceae bacterium]|nr:GtrA family protein [Saprospiraceae bacterium]
MIDHLKKLIFLKARFAASGLVATSLDYILYMVLVTHVFSPVISNLISYSIAVIANFLMQKRFVFNLKGSARQAFILSVSASLIGLLISTGIIYLLNQNIFFSERQYLTKILATGLIFFYNFYTKRFIFERKIFDVD